MDIDKDGKAELNVDFNKDEIADINIDTNKDNKPDVSINYINNWIAIFNFDLDGDKIADLFLAPKDSGKSSYNFVISRVGYAGGTYKVWDITLVGNITYYTVIDGDGAIPTLYLESHVTKDNGTGTYTDPYILIEYKALIYAFFLFLIIYFYRRVRIWI